MGINSTIDKEVSKGYAEVVKLLLERRTNIDVKDISNNNILKLTEMYKQDMSVNIYRKT